MSESAGEATRRPMRGIVYWDVRYFHKGGWEITSAAETSDDSFLEWDGPTVSDAVFYTGMRALRHERELDLHDPDEVLLKMNRDKQGCHVVEIASCAIGLVTIPADARVSTLDWGTFRASEATVEKVAKLDRLSSLPASKIPARALELSFRSPRFRAGDAPITNIAAFEEPPMAGAINRWNSVLPPHRQIQMKSLDFIETTSEPTTEVSRVPAMLQKYKFARLSPESEDDFEIIKEFVDGIPVILNHTQDAKVIRWLINGILLPSLEEQWEHGERWGFTTAREHLRQRLGEINSPAVRAQFDEVVRFARPTREFQSQLE